MADFERERSIPAGARAVFRVATDTASLQAWVPDGLEVERSGPERVTGHVTIGEDEHDADGYWSVDAEEMRAEWGDLDGGGYSGWLQVTERDADNSSVTLHLTLNGGQPENVGGEATELTEEYVDQALERLAALVVDRGAS
jgi:uncharacterized protein YndB with AHSA1/START domain